MYFLFDEIFLIFLWKVFAICGFVNVTAVKMAVDYDFETKSFRFQDDQRNVQNYHPWKFCSRKLTHAFSENNSVEISISPESDEDHDEHHNYANHHRRWKCIQRIEPFVFNLDINDHGVAENANNTSFEIGIIFNREIVDDFDASTLCALYRPSNEYLLHIVNLKVVPYKNEIRLDVSKAEVLALTTQTAAERGDTNMTDSQLVLDIQCTLANGKELLPRGIKILFANFSKFVSSFNAPATVFHATNPQKILKTYFAAELPSQFEGLPICIVDASNFTIPARISENSHSLLCDFSHHELSPGKHSVWVVRSPELLSATLHSQTPFELFMQTDFDVTTNNGSVPLYSNGSIRNLRFKSARFSDSLEQLLLEANFESNPGIWNVENQSNHKPTIMYVPCENVFVAFSMFGENPKCGFWNMSYFIVEFGDGPTINFGDEISVKIFEAFDDIFLNNSRTSDSLTVQRAQNLITPNVSVECSKSHLSCDNTEDVYFQVTSLAGTGRRPFTCQWRISSADPVEMEKMGKSLSECNLTIPANRLNFLRDPVDKSLSVSAFVCNFASICADAGPLKVGLKANTSEFSVDILGVPAQPLCSLRITMSAYPKLTVCGGTDSASSKSLLLTGIAYKWNINGSDVSHNRIFNIASNAYECGEQIFVELFVEFHRDEDSTHENEESMSASASVRIVFMPEALVTVVDGMSRTVAVDEMLRLDASHSWSPNGRSRVLSHQWECRNLSSLVLPPQLNNIAQNFGNFAHNEIVTNGAINQNSADFSALGSNLSSLSEFFNTNFTNFTCYFPQKQQTESAISPGSENTPNWTYPVLTIPPNLLLPVNGIFLFRDVMNDGKVNGGVYVKVQIQQTNVPVVRLVPLNDVEHLNSNNFLRMQAFVRSKCGDLSIFWQLFFVNENFTTVDLSGITPSKIFRNFSQSETLASGGIALSLIIPPAHHSNIKGKWRGLEPNGNYTLRLNAANRVGSSFADCSFRVHPPPALDKVLVDPSRGILALETTVRLYLPQKLDADFRGQLRFGIRTYLVGGRTRTFWSRSSTVDFYEMLLPSAWMEPHAACGERIGFQALIEVCDVWGACRVAESDRFVVGHALDPTEAVRDAVKTVQSLITDGDSFKASELLEAVRLERCNDTLDPKLVDKVLSKLLAEGILSSTQDADELLEGLQFAMRIVNYASPKRVDDILSLMNRVRDSLHMNSSALPYAKPVEFEALKTPEKPLSDYKFRDANSASIGSSRSKRSVNLIGAMLSDGSTSSIGVNEAAASTLLGAYDLLMGRKQDVVRVYLNNVNDILSGFCVQSNTLKTMHASGKTYTEVQSQNIVPAEEGFVNSSFTVAGVESEIVSFDAEFSALFSNWQCADGSVSCSEICFGTAQTSLSALTDNPHLQRYFFTSQYSNVKLEEAVSDLHHFSFMDPINGKPQLLRSGAEMIVNVPISKYLPSDYYKCFVFTGTNWEENACTSNDYALANLNVDPPQFYLVCRCAKTGILGVFTVNPPTPPYFPPYNEIQLTFYLSSAERCTRNELHTFVVYLTVASGVRSDRFVQLTCDLINGTSPNASITTNNLSYLGIVGAILRPPFRKHHLSNSYAMQAIKRTIGMDSGFTAYGKVKVINMTDFTIYRRLNGDHNARRVTLHIDRSLKDVVGNDSLIFATRWTAQMAESMRISKYRFKNPIIMIGIIFNFTITIPFTGEAGSFDNETILNAEEIAQWIKEQIKYGELDLRDGRDQLLPVDALMDGDIVELRVATTTSTLMLALAVIISTIFVLTSICVGGLVFVKIRTDRLIEAHNANMRTIDISETVPISVLPSDATSDDMRNAEGPLDPNIQNEEDENLSSRKQNKRKQHRHHHHHQRVRHRRNEVDNKASDTIVFSGRHT